MLQLLKSKRHSYSGRESYRYVERVIRNGRNVAISSPFIDSYYANFLVRNAKGKRIRVLSSSMEKGAEKILNGGGIRWWTLKLSSATLAFNIFLFAFKLSTLPVIAASAAIILACIAFFRRGNPGISVKIPKSFVHAKMYIADNEAAEGSANLTYAGMHKNIEHVEVVTDPEDVKELRYQFQKIWESS